MEAHIAGVDVIFVWNQARTLVDTHTDTACLCVWNENGNEDKISKLNVREIELRVHFRVNSDTIFFSSFFCFSLHKSKEDRKSKHISLLN